MTRESRTTDYINDVIGLHPLPVSRTQLASIILDEYSIDIIRPVNSLHSGNLGKTNVVEISALFHHDLHDLINLSGKSRWVLLFHSNQQSSQTFLNALEEQVVDHLHNNRVLSWIKSTTVDTYGFPSWSHLRFHQRFQLFFGEPLNEIRKNLLQWFPKYSLNSTQHPAQSFARNHDVSRSVVFTNKKSINFVKLFSIIYLARFNHCCKTTLSLFFTSNQSPEIFNVSNLFRFLKVFTLNKLESVEALNFIQTLTEVFHYPLEPRTDLLSKPDHRILLWIQIAR